MSANAKRTRLGLLGSKGRMGREVSSLLYGPAYVTRAELGAAIDNGDPLESLLNTEVVIDFSSPDAVLALVERMRHAEGQIPALVLGSTGWTLEGRAALREISEKTPVLMSANFSTGVLLVLEMLKEYSPLFEKFGYTPVIVEAHHSHKKDSPSGTALSLQRAIAPAGPGNVQTLAVRAGEVIGDHEVTFYGPSDEIRVAHHARDRAIFARGAIDVALWLAGRKASLKGMLGMDAYFKELRS